MIKRNNHIVLLFALFALFTSCQKVTIKIDSIPANTPNGTQIYIAGNFNNWNPADPNFILEYKNDSAYYVTLPYGFGILEYKFTRGSWETVETDECGHQISNRKYTYTKYDTIINAIESWDDKEPLNCPRLTIIIDSVPENTPDSAVITIAGNFNEWNPYDENYRFSRNSKGGFEITMMKPQKVNEIEFKFTRGDLSKVEADKYGNEIPTRTIKFGITDTIVASVESWEDLSETRNKYLTVVLEKVPEKTNNDDRLYLVGNINGWYPRDKSYQFNRMSDGTYFINLPRKDGKLEFKVTRGSWETQELDKKGSVISNREFWYKDFDTIFISVENWADRLPAKRLVFILFDVPDYTPEADNIYITGNFNGWDPKDKRFIMEKTSDGKYLKEVEIDNKHVEYKFTRGSWETEEADENGYRIENRKHKYIGIDTIFMSIKNWYDLPGEGHSVVLVIDKIPEYTPENAKIYLASDINGWNPSDKQFIMKEKNGKYYFDVIIRKRDIYYKFTRGGWGSVEGDRFGGEIENRKLYYNYQDTIYHQVLSWKDLHRKR